MALRACAFNRAVSKSTTWSAQSCRAGGFSEICRVEPKAPERRL